MKIYISGKITGLDRTVYSRNFEQAETLIKEAGYTPVNPVRNGLDPESPWAEHLVADIELLIGCDAIVMLPGWTESKGACLEWKIAQKANILILNYDLLQTDTIK